MAVPMRSLPDLDPVVWQQVVSLGGVVLPLVQGEGSSPLGFPVNFGIRVSVSVRAALALRWGWRVSWPLSWGVSP